MTDIKVAIPRLGDSIAPLFESAATISTFSIRDKMIANRVDFALQSKEALDRVRLLRDQGVDTLICGGVQRVIENILEANGIRVISFVSGTVDELLGMFMRGQLVSGKPGDPHGKS